MPTNLSKCCGAEIRERFGCPYHLTSICIDKPKIWYECNLCFLPCTTVPEGEEHCEGCRNPHTGICNWSLCSCHIKVVNPPSEKQEAEGWRQTFLQIVARKDENFVSRLGDFISQTRKEATETERNRIGKVVEGMSRGACCDCKPEKDYKCYHAGREDAITSVLSALTEPK